MELELMIPTKALLHPVRPGFAHFPPGFSQPKLATPKLLAMRRSSVCAKRSCRRWLFAGPCGSIWTWKKWYDDEHKRLFLRE